MGSVITNHGGWVTRLVENGFEIKKLAELAYLSVDETQMVELKRDLKEILGYMERLREICTEGVTPLFHPDPNTQNVWREDEAIPEDIQSSFLEQAPSSRGSRVLVPRFVGSEESNG